MGFPVQTAEEVKSDDQNDDHVLMFVLKKKKSEKNERKTIQFKLVTSLLGGWMILI